MDMSDAVMRDDIKQNQRGKILKLKPKKVDIGKLPVFRPLNTDEEHTKTLSFYENVLKKTGRDRTVQRVRLEKYFKQTIRRISYVMLRGDSLTAILHSN